MPYPRHTARVILPALLLAAAACLPACSRADSTPASAPQNSNAEHTEHVSHEPRTVEAACGECQFGLEGDSCDLAVRIDGVAYFVDGTTIDDHGDAHADDGFCNAVRHAKVTGEVVDGRFVAESFELLED